MANAQIVPTTTVGEAYKSVAELDGISFAIVNTADGKALHGSNNQNLAYSEYSAAFSSGNTGYMWKLVSVPSDADEAIQGCYYLQLITPKGENYNCWGMGGYLNSQPATGGCSFILGLNNQHGQDGVNLAVYDIQYVEGQGFALKNIGTGMYQGYNTLPANSADPVYWTFAPVENSYVPALEALLAEGEAMKATVTNAYAAAVYTNAIAGIDPATTTDALADAKKVDAAITELAKAIPAEAGTDFTRAIVNPSFEAGSIEGWTESYGGNSANNGNFGAAAGSYFVERWQDKANGGLSDGSIMQTITGLPNGTYKLTAPMQNLEQYNGDAAGKGYLLVANDDSTEVAVSGETVEVTTEVTDGTLAIGAVLKGCTGNWVCVDNFQLTLVEYKSPAPVVKDAWYTDGAFAIVGHDFVDGVKNEFVEPRWIQDAAGEAYLEVTSCDNPAQEWDSQFFITLNDELKVGDKVNFSMLVRGAAEGTMSTQTHSTPGSYVGGLWADIPVTTEWVKYEGVYTVSNAAAKTLVFNLAKAATANSFQFDEIAISIEKAPEFEWVDIIKNGDMEGTDMSCFYKTEQGVGGPFKAVATAEAGKDGSAAVEIQSGDSPSAAWDTQFFIRLPYVLPAGTHFLVEFDYKADQAAASSTQSHVEPGAYKHYAAIGSPSFTTEWQTYSYEGFVASEADGMYSIAFNLAESAVATKYTIDNVKFYVQDNVLPELVASPDLSKKEFAVSVERYPGQGYVPQTAEADIEAIKSFLGVEALTTDMLSIVNPDGTEVSDYATYDGWFATDGTAKTWSELGTEAGVCVKFFQALESGSFAICDMNGADEIGKTYTVKFALKANGNTATVSINVTFVEKPVLALTYADLNNVQDMAVTIESETGSYFEGLKSDVDVASIVEALNVASLDEVSIFAVQPDGTLDDSYGLGTTDGWRNADGSWLAYAEGAYFYVKANFALESGQLYEVGGMPEKTNEPVEYTATYAFVNMASDAKDAVTLKVSLIYTAPDAIEGVDAAAPADGKYIENGQIVIIKNGVKYNAAGQIVK